MEGSKNAESELDRNDLVHDFLAVARSEAVDLTDEERKEYYRRKAVLRSAKELGLPLYRYSKLLVVDEAEREKNGILKLKDVPSAAKLYRWNGKKDDPKALIRGAGGIGAPPKMSNWHVLFILEMMAVNWDSKASYIHETMKKFADFHGLSMVGQKAVRNFVRKCNSRGGINDILSKFRQGKIYSEYRIAFHRVYRESNEVWETDGTSLPLVIYIKGIGKIKPYLLLTIDCFSGLPVGWTLLKGVANSADNIGHLKDAMLPKGDGPAWGGIPREIQSDNAKIYESAEIERMGEKLNIKIEKSPPYCPSANGLVERLNKTVKDRFVSGFVGYVKSRKRLSKASFYYTGTWESLCKEFESFMIEYAHTHVRRGHDQTVLGEWMEGMEDLESVFGNEDLLHKSCLIEYEGTMQTDGVHVRGIPFVSDQLQVSRGKRVTLLINPGSEPKVVIARVRGQDIPLVRNSRADLELVRRCRKAQDDENEALIETCKVLREAKGRLDIYAPSTAAGLKDRRARSKPTPPTKDPTIRIEIPTFRKSNLNH